MFSWMRKKFWQNMSLMRDKWTTRLTEFARVFWNRSEKSHYPLSQDSETALCSQMHFDISRKQCVFAIHATPRYTCIMDHQPLEQTHATMASGPDRYVITISKENIGREPPHDERRWHIREKVFDVDSRVLISNRESTSTLTLVIVSILPWNQSCCKFLTDFLVCRCTKDLQELCCRRPFPRSSRSEI